jgi:hypothetical protein
MKIVCSFCYCDWEKDGERLCHCAVGGPTEREESVLGDIRHTRAIGTRWIAQESKDRKRWWWIVINNPWGSLTLNSRGQWVPFANGHRPKPARFQCRVSAELAAINATREGATP